MKVTYRNYKPEDIDNIIRFWNENSGWETGMDRTEFNLRFCSSPFGDVILMLAIDESENAILGLCCFMAASVTVKGKDVISYRPFGAILKENFRESFGITSLLTGHHPILQLYHAGSEVAKQKKASLIYLIPDPRWNKIRKAMPFDVHLFSLWSYLLQRNQIFGNDNFEVKSLSSDEADIDDLWERCSKMSFCTLTKNSVYYRFKINMRHGLYHLYGVYQNDWLIGLFTLHFKSGEQQWLIGDLLTLDNNETLFTTLKAACYAAQLQYLEKPTTEDKPFKVAILATHFIEQHLKTLGFHKDDYRFTLAIQLLNKQEFSKADVAPEQWFINAND